MEPSSLSNKKQPHLPNFKLLLRTFPGFFRQFSDSPCSIPTPFFSLPHGGSLVFGSDDAGFSSGQWQLGSGSTFQRLWCWLGNCLGGQLSRLVQSNQAAVWEKRERSEMPPLFTVKVERCFYTDFFGGKMKYQKSRISFCFFVWYLLIFCWVCIWSMYLVFFFPYSKLGHVFFFLWGFFPKTTSGGRVMRPMEVMVRIP